MLLPGAGPFCGCTFQRGVPRRCSICNLRALPAERALKLFFIKKAQKFDRGDEKMGTAREDNKEELSLPWL